MQTKTTKVLKLLYVQVLIGLALGILVGFLFPDFGASLKVLGDLFIKVVKMMIAPIVFCTIVTGITSLTDSKKIGRTLGYPTANVALDRYLRPRFGVYAVRGLLPGGRVANGVANLGTRPMFDPPKELLEPYFFDFDGDLYDQVIEVELIDFIREEARFEDLDALKAQIARDCEVARELLAP